MFRSIVGGMLLVGATVALFCGSATAAQRGKPPAPPVPPWKQGSAKWDYSVVDEQNKLVEAGVFFAKKSKIMNGFGNQVGTYVDVSETHVTGEVFKGKLEGKMDVRRETPASLTWHGELVRPAGAKYKITIVFEKMK